MTAITLDNIYKYYQLYSNDYQRLVEIFTGKSQAEVIKALEPTSLQIGKGQVVGIIGKNGAGKSTLLKLISGTANPTGGQLKVNGRIVALLELGASFHPELTGHENIYLYGSILDISRARMDEMYDEIVDFSGIGKFIHQPVKTYSSGMFVRLAFSVATSVDPDILIIDEALSVGDGQFARKSFDRIMKFKESGKTILFCSHMMFHIESICDRAVWIENGKVKMDGIPAVVVLAYNATMKNQAVNKIGTLPDSKDTPELEQNKIEVENLILAKFIQASVKVDDKTGKNLAVKSGQSNLTVIAEFESDFSIQVPNFAMTITDENDFPITSACTLVDDYIIDRNKNGDSTVELSFSRINLLKGQYFINVYLMCESCILTYDQVLRITELNVSQKTQELGMVRLDHSWSLGHQ